MLRLEPRPQPSRVMFTITPLLALLLTLLAAIVLFALLEKPPLQALSLIFVAPLTSLRGIAELMVKSTPLILCAIGLLASDLRWDFARAASHEYLLLQD